LIHSLKFKEVEKFQATRSICEMSPQLALLFVLLAVVAPACTQKFQTANLGSEEEIRQFEDSVETPCPVRIERNVDKSRIPSTYSEVICESKANCESKAICIQLFHKLETRLLTKNGTCKTKFVEQRVGCVPGKAKAKSKSVKKVPPRS
jgi:hypothetical protein